MKVFFVVLARDRSAVDRKVKELSELGYPYIIVCGERISHPNVAYREPKGKYDAINFGLRFVPQNVDVVALNDVDNKIYNFGAMLKHFDSKDVALAFARISVKEGPQKFFNVILDAIRRKLPIASNGDLMLVRQGVLRHILPIKPCKAEDSYILFKVLELKLGIVFCEECYVKTEKTKHDREEEAYKRRTVCGLYQALAFTKPPVAIRMFYTLLPIASPLLLVLGKKGYFWMKGILLGLRDFLGGDRRGFWHPTLMD